MICHLIGMLIIVNVRGFSMSPDLNPPIEPDESLAFNSPDEVAECWSGIDAGSELYAKLWSMTEFYDRSFSEEPDPEKNNTALFWDKFTYEQKVALNAAAKKRNEQWDLAVEWKEE